MKKQLEVPQSEINQYWGKYRAIVIENVDPIVLGRVMVKVPQLPNLPITWAMPCVPYPVNQEAILGVPHVGASVWIEFEHGNPNFPIWTGCFWHEGEVPLLCNPVEAGS